MCRNKIPHILKGINGVAFIFSFQCEKGKMHENKVKFDQVNNAAKEGVDCFRRKCNLNGRNITWWRKPNMWGPRQEALICIQGGRGIHRGLCFEYLISCLLRLFVVSCYLAELQFYLAWGIPVQDSLCFLRGLLRDFTSFLHIQAQVQATSFIYNIISTQV